ncbi:MAG: glycosyltransferase [Bergeyella sp.]|nr:glycosyltransferase [Bergeyella sp.]
MKKTIIFLIPDLEMGGAERMVVNITNSLSREHFIPKIVVLRKEGGYINLLKKDTEIIDLNIRRIRNALIPIFRILRKIKPDIVFSAYGELNAFITTGIILFPKIKFVARETNVVSLHVKRKEILFFYNFYHLYHRIICQSEDMKQDLIENLGIKNGRLIKINNPVDIKFIENQITKNNKPAIFSEHKKNVLAIGNLSSRKGFDNLLKVFSHLKDEEIALHILGDGRDREELIELKNKLDLKQVFFHGKKSNPYNYLYHADLFVLSSRYEGFPNVLLEAGACGTYSLANHCPGGISEIIQEKINGEIASVEDHSNFARRIQKSLDISKDREKIKNSIRSRFSLEKIIQEYTAIFSDL